jgi:hypothetical protein
MLVSAAGPCNFLGLNGDNYDKEFEKMKLPLFGIEK